MILCKMVGKIYQGPTNIFKMTNEKYDYYIIIIYLVGLDPAEFGWADL